jgi:hypothetical protein
LESILGILKNLKIRAHFSQGIDSVESMLEVLKSLKILSLDASICPIKQERFEANFIPHDPGRHRVDVKFNGEKVPNSPWFVEVKVRKC